MTGLPLRLNVTQMRVGLLASNAVLTLLFAYQAYLGLFHPVQIPGTKDFELDRLKYRGGVKPQAGNDSAQLIEIAKVIQPPPPVEPVKTPDKEIKPAADDGKEAPDGLKPGPLNGTWEYISVIEDPSDPENSLAILKKKEAAATGLPGPTAGARKPAGSTPRPVVRPLPRKTAGAGTVSVAMPTDRRTVRVWDDWEDDETKAHVGVLEIRRDRLVYEDFSSGKQYALRRRQSTAYEDGPGHRLSRQKDENSDPNAAAGTATADAKGADGPLKLKWKAPDRKEEYLQKRGKGGSGGGMKAVETPAKSAATPPGAKPAPPSANDVKKLGQTLGDIEKSEKYKKMSPKEREDFQKVQALLKEAK